MSSQPPTVVEMSPSSGLPPCPLCGASETKAIYQLTGYRVARCTSCHFDFNGDFHGGGETGQTFDRDYYMEAHRAAFANHAKDYSKDPSLKVFENRLKQVEAQIGVGRVLDVGPGLGTFVKMASTRGWNAEAVEISEYAANHIRETHGLQVFNGDLQKFPGEDESFDLVTFWDSVEHVAYPKQNLETAYRLIKPGGMILLTTDNFDCLVADIASLFYKATAGWCTYPLERVFIDRNYGFFTDETCRALVERVGFHDVVIDKMEYPLKKIKLSVLERLALTSIYGMAKLTGRQAQITVMAKKPQ